MAWDYLAISILHSDLFTGDAVWDAPAQSGKPPFYEKYENYAKNTKLVGQSYSIVPEFRMSSHVETYEKLGVTEELLDIFELSGARSENTTTVQ